MAFEKYQVKNNAYGNLIAGIGASATSLQTGAGEGARFPTGGDTIATLVQYTIPSDPTSDILKEESILITNRSGDVFTITRGFGGDTATGFNTGDWIYLNVRAEIIQDIYDEADRLGTAKLDKGALRTGLTNAWRLFFSNASKNETELGLGANGTYLQSTGASGVPIWGIPSVDINGQSADNTDPGVSDYLIWYRNGVGNVKRLMKATTSVFGLVKIATDGEVITGTDTEKAVTPKTLKDNYNTVFPGDSVSYVSSASGSITGSTYSTAYSYTATKSGIFKVSYSAYRGGDGIGGAGARVLVNGITYLEIPGFSSYSSDSRTGSIPIGKGSVVSFQGFLPSGTMSFSSINIKGDR